MVDEAVFDIKEEGVDLHLDEQRTIICPFCQADWEAQGKPTHWKPYKSRCERHDC